MNLLKFEGVGYEAIIHPDDPETNITFLKAGNDSDASPAFVSIEQYEGLAESANMILLTRNEAVALRDYLDTILITL